VAAWAIDHPGERVPHVTLFPQYLQAIRDGFFQERRKVLVGIAREVITRITGEGDSLDDDATRRADEVLASLKSDRGYEDRSARDALAALLKERFADGGAAAEGPRRMHARSAGESSWGTRGSPMMLCPKRS
jgi:serine protein kinase